MKIGVIKPGKKIYFYDNDDDHAAISIEVTRLIRIMANRGHEVFILTDNDYLPGSISNVSREHPEALDKVFMFNGPDSDKTIEEFSFLLKKIPEINLIVTDLMLVPTLYSLRLFTHIYTQSKRQGEYGAIQEHECLDFIPQKYEKTQDIYFGGTERGRSKDFFEYVYRPNVKWFGKSDTLNIRNYIPYSKHIEEMKKSRYSIVIGDDEYNRKGFVTPRFYECIRYGVIPFVDDKFDPDEIILPHNDFLRVSSYKEMLVKIKQIGMNTEEIIESLNRTITRDMISGNNIVKLLNL